MGERRFRRAKTKFRGRRSLFRGPKSWFRRAKSELRKEKSLFVLGETAVPGSENRVPSGREFALASPKFSVIRCRSGLGVVTDGCGFLWKRRRGGGRGR